METKVIYQNSLLAEASYADLENVSTKLQLENALINIDGQDEGFAPDQAEEFVKKWQVLHHQSNTLSGFSATLFERLDDEQNGTGNNWGQSKIKSDPIRNVLNHYRYHNRSHQCQHHQDHGNTGNTFRHMLVSIRHKHRCNR